MAGDADGEKKTNKPEDTAFKQQRLKAWQPILTPTWVIGAFVLIGLIFIPVGVMLTASSKDVFEAKVTYDSPDFNGGGVGVSASSSQTGILSGALAGTRSWCNISNNAAPIEELYNYGYKQLNKEQPANLTSTCTIQFVLSEADAKNANNKEIYVYYELKKFYQNHRRYVKSRSDDQLRNEGVKGPSSDLETACDPEASYKVVNTLGGSFTDYHYWPCGLIATSVFNDGLFYKPPAGLADSPQWLTTDIAWSSDMAKKFKNPTVDYSVWQYNWQTYSQLGCYTAASVTSTDPTTWERAKSCKTWAEGDCPAMTVGTSVFEKDKVGGGATVQNATYKDNCCSCNGDDVLKPEGGIMPPNGDTGGLKDEHFVVWMRTAGLPTFRKLYAKIPAKSWTAGDKVTIVIVPNFVVSTFEGSKAIVISTTSWLGGKNDVLGVSYIVVGTICWLLALVFALKQYISPRKLGDTKYLVWKNRGS